MKMSGAQAVIESLKQEGVEVVFGYPGGKVLTLYDELFKTGFRHILIRHEQAAAHAADGYARVTGKVGVCISTSGPGATNLVTGIATAYMDSIPLVAITGQVGVSLIGKDSFQEADIRGITTPITKHNYLVKQAEELPRVMKEAFYIARTGRPGPVVVDIASDVFAAELDFNYPDSVTLRGYKPIFAGDEAVLNQVVAAILQARKPLAFVGGGVVLSDTARFFRELISLTGMPVIASMMGLGCLPAKAEQNLGMVGMHGTYAANMATTECDLLLGIGVRFDDRVTGLVHEFAPKAKVVHFDIDPAEINKNIHADIRVIGDLRWSLPTLCEKLAGMDCREMKRRTQPWQECALSWKEQYPLRYERQPGMIMPQTVVETVSRMMPDDALIVTDVGQHQMWAAQYYGFKISRSLLTSGGLGTMGYGLPAALGAQISAPDRKVLLFTGDGGFMMNCQELATIAEHVLPVKILVMNNQTLGMVSQWQRMFYGQRYSHSSLKGGTDFVKLAEAMGIEGVRISKPEELEPVLARIIASDTPVLADICLPSEVDVLPMVPAGARLDQMVLMEGRS